MDACRENFQQLSNGGRIQIFHKSCDGLINFYSGSFICSVCTVSWRQSWVENTASSDDIGYRFKVNTLTDDFMYKIVEVCDGPVRYQTLKKIESTDKEADDFSKSMDEFFKN